MLSRRARGNRAGCSFRAWLRNSTSLGWVQIASVTAAVGLGIVAAGPAEAQQVPASAFQPYNPASASSIQAGPFSLYAVPVDEIQPGQLNVGSSEVARKMYGWDTLTPSQIQSTLL